MGSYVVYISDPENDLIINSIKKGNDNVTQNDLNTIGDLNLTIICQYKGLGDITLNIKLTNNKLDISLLTSIIFRPVSVDLDTATNNSLTSNDVTKITESIKNEISEDISKIQNNFPKEGTNYTISGIGDTVKVGADFSTPQTITFNINSVPESKFMTGSLNNLKIKVTATNP